MLCPQNVKNLPISFNFYFHNNLEKKRPQISVDPPNLNIIVKTMQNVVYSEFLSNPELTGEISKAAEFLNFLNFLTLSFIL